ncbi:MAG: hypothetical protein HC849_18515 [Oscillatoriales cyanobacterium RU_3_3]|nr:hypothetical protein [Oscillatoriales cyanobacterium RU_3_3]
MKLAASIVLVTLIVITGISWAKQELPSVQIAQYSVLNNFQLASGLQQPEKVRETPKKVREMPEKVRERLKKVREILKKVQEMPKNDRIIPRDMCNPPGSCDKKVITGFTFNEPIG